jgi:hypothetical protein
MQSIPARIGFASAGLPLFCDHLTTACNVRLSSNSSATACFSCRFSSSSCRNRRAPLTSIPPYFAFQHYRLPRVIPCRRHSSSGPIPASLLQDGDGLFFVDSTLGHDSSSLALSRPSYMEKSHFHWTTFRGGRSISASYSARTL